MDFEINFLALVEGMEFELENSMCLYLESIKSLLTGIISTPKDLKEAG